MQMPEIVGDVVRSVGLSTAMKAAGVVTGLLPIPQPALLVGADALDPHRVDVGNAAGKQARGFDELGRHHQLGLLLEQARPGEDREPRVAGAEVVAPVGVTAMS